MREWIVKRGVLYGLTQTPMLALMVGSFFRWTDYGTATAFTVIVAFVALPIWVIVRRNRSDDPDEPVHHLPRYALWALIPYVVYNISRVPMHYSLGVVFWDHWYDFGSELTGNPVDQWASLIPGTFLHSLQGYVLALGFFILFKRHSLLNALAYVWVFLSAIYTWTFPTYVLVDFQPPPKWYFLVWWAHFWMALAAWYVPKVVGRRGPRRMSALARAALLTIAALLYIYPVAFVFARVATWQFPYQRELDANLFREAQLRLAGGVAVAESRTLGGARAATAPGGEAPSEARYRFTLRFGPRSYKDYIKATKALDAGPVRVSGRLFRPDGTVLAWCSSYTTMLETPNTITSPALYFPTLKRMEYTSIPVDCSGPVDRSVVSGGGTVDLAWTARVKLRGDREVQDRTFGGRHQDLGITVKEVI